MELLEQALLTLIVFLGQKSLTVTDFLKQTLLSYMGLLAFFFYGNEHLHIKHNYGCQGYKKKKSNN